VRGSLAVSSKNEESGDSPIRHHLLGREISINEIVTEIVGDVNHTQMDLTITPRNSMTFIRDHGREQSPRNHTRKDDSPQMKT
jgi:hypothetical protein